MAVEEDENLWASELETALLGDCSPADIFTKWKGKKIPDSLRADVWQMCFDLQDKKYNSVVFDDIFDLPEQKILREDCQKFVDKLGNDDEDKVSVISDLESILTFYCKSTKLKYERRNGWIEILLPLIALKLQRTETYNLFQAIINRFIPRCCTKNGIPFHLFRLLLLYHDPQLCSFLDTKKISPDLYCMTWFQSLFAATCNLNAIFAMWDLYFQKSDPFFVFFLALVMMVNAREQIMDMKNENKESIVNALVSMPCALVADDVTDFCSLAQYHALKTPNSFRKDLADFMFGSNAHGATDAEAVTVSQALCLPVSAEELVANAESTHDSDSLEGVRFFLVDCRPAEQYNSGHLPTAFHLDCNLMLQEPAAFSTAVQGLLSAQRQSLAARSAAGGEHLCFLGSGREEEDQYTHMVVASFLQKHTHYVAMVTGGYQAIHDYLADDVGTSLQEHNPQSCLVCMPGSIDEESETIRPSSSSQDLFGKISAVMKSKSAEVKEKLMDYIVNPNGNQSVERHVSRNDKVGKRYRNMAPVFSIDDDHEGDGSNTESPEEDERQEVTSIQAWLKKPEIVESFRCKEVKLNKRMYDSYLLVSESHIFLLREIPSREGYAHVVVKRPLSAIVKITSRKKNPKVITFNYGTREGDELNVMDMDRIFIPEAAEATKLVTTLILESLKETKS
ncbi:TBC1 domain family member 23 isoform X1 [Hetaerina americana]|uniref:TBC1 domain family member 23 isoform X1 n=1 Tax=Hetaerina americana TaxID=62018 RepID=UPI003A7F2467